jgi:hypothetical protein
MRPSRFRLTAFPDRDGLPEHRSTIDRDEREFTLADGIVTAAGRALTGGL